MPKELKLILIVAAVVLVGIYAYDRGYILSPSSSASTGGY
jgi:hypothetical protein